MHSILIAVGIINGIYDLLNINLKIKWPNDIYYQDQKIGGILIETKLKTGYPDKFRTCWGKNISEQIFKIANMLHTNGLEKGITLARQTNSLEALNKTRKNRDYTLFYSEVIHKVK